MLLDHYKLITHLHQFLNTPHIMSLKEKITGMPVTLQATPAEGRNMESQDNSSEGYSQSSTNPSTWTCSCEQQTSLQAQPVVAENKENSPLQTSNGHQLSRTPGISSELTSTLEQVLRYCEPHVLSGGCQLLHNLLLAFPEFIATHVQSAGLIKNLLW